MPFEMHSGKNSPRLAISKNFRDFFKKTRFFPEKPQILNVLKNPTISVAFYDKFTTI